MILPVTLTMSAAVGLLNVWLSIRCGRVRAAAKVEIGDGGNQMLLRRMRAQSNFIENTPFVLILLGLIELARGTTIALWLAGILYILARVLHAFGMDRTGYNRMRMIGVLVTNVTLVGLAGYALWVVYVMPTVID